MKDVRQTWQATLSRLPEPAQRRANRLLGMLRELGIPEHDAVDRVSSAAMGWQQSNSGGSPPQSS